MAGPGDVHAGTTDDDAVPTPQDRRAAVEALDVHREAGRLDDVGFEERSVRVDRATTLEDLRLLFLDLPEPHPVLGAPSSPAYGTPSAPAPAQPPAPVPASSPPAPPAPSGGGLLPERYAGIVTALAPFLALFLFFRTGSWVWFLLIPVVAIVANGPKDKRRRR